MTGPSPQARTLDSSPCGRLVRRPSKVSPHWSTATVNDVASPVDGDANGMASIEADSTSGTSNTGDVLTNSSGEILGLRDRSARATTVRTASDTAPALSGVTESPSTASVLLDDLSRPNGASPAATGESEVLDTVSSATDEVFLPAQLVVGVASDLAHFGHDRHGWLGISGETSTTPNGSTSNGSSPNAEAPLPTQDARRPPDHRSPGDHRRAVRTVVRGPGGRRHHHCDERGPDPNDGRTTVPPLRAGARVRRSSDTGAQGQREGRHGQAVLRPLARLQRSPTPGPPRTPPRRLASSGRRESHSMRAWE